MKAARRNVQRNEMASARDWIPNIKVWCWSAHETGEVTIVGKR